MKVYVFCGIRRRLSITRPDFRPVTQASCVSRRRSWRFVDRASKGILGTGNRVGNDFRVPRGGLHPSCNYLLKRLRSPCSTAVCNKLE